MLPLDLLLPMGRIPKYSWVFSLWLEAGISGVCISKEGVAMMFFGSFLAENCSCDQAAFVGDASSSFPKTANSWANRSWKLKRRKDRQRKGKRKKKQKTISAPQLCHVHPCGQGTEVSGNFKNADLLCTLQWCSVKMLVSSVCSYRQINVHSKYILV